MPNQCRQRGRGRSKRWVGFIPPISRYQPQGDTTNSDSVTKLTVEEVEALRLVDYIGLSQEDAAEKMHVSRKTLWVDLQGARKKIIGAIITGSTIEIIEGDYIHYKEDR